MTVCTADSIAMCEMTSRFPGSSPSGIVARGTGRGLWASKQRLTIAGVRIVAARAFASACRNMGERSLPRLTNLFLKRHPVIGQPVTTVVFKGRFGRHAVIEDGQRPFRFRRRKNGLFLIFLQLFLE